MEELEYMKQIDSIQRQISCMENELNILKLAQDSEITKRVLQRQSPIKNYPSPESLGSTSFGDTVDQPIMDDHPGIPLPPSRPLSAHYDYNEDCDNEDWLVFVSHYPYISHPAYNKKERKKNCRTLLKVDKLEAKISKQAAADNCKPWVLTIKNGNMTIDTHIKSHSELMSNMFSMLNTASYQQKTSNLPFPLNITPTASSDTGMSLVMTIFVWRKYGKSRFKSISKCAPILFNTSSPQHVSAIISIEDLNVISLRLICTYFQCFHLQHFAIYIPEFVRLFMCHEENITKSPAVMALCSTICMQTCHHIFDILPRDTLLDYGLYYFEQARELIADKFDHVDMETLCTYVFMAIYKLKNRDDNECKKYISMANRICAILLPQYDTQSQRSSLSEESFLFYRLYNSISHCQSGLEMNYLIDNMYRARSIKPNQVFQLLDEHDRKPVVIAPGDSEREVRFTKMRRYLCQLKEAIKESAQGAAASDLPSYIGIFGHHIEMAMRHWYRSILPKEYQLSLPLFDDQHNDLDFFATLEAECGDSPIALITTLSLYNEYLIMAKSYIPKSPQDAEIDINALIRNFKELQYSTDHSLDNRKVDPVMGHGLHHWLKAFMKMRYLKHHHHHSFTTEEIDEPDEEYFTRFIKALNLSKINFEMPIILISIKAALNTVRLVQFLLSRDYACFLDLRWIMNAWEILLRAARYKYQQLDDDSVTLDRIRANLILCLGIAKKHLECSGRDPSGAFIQELEEEFNKIFV